LLRAPAGFVQGYNAQAAATIDQIIVAAEVTNDANDGAQFAPMVATTKTNLRHAGARTRVRTVVADAGYFSKDNVSIVGVEALIAPGKRDVGRQARVEAQRSEVLTRVEQGAISRDDAAVELGIAGHGSISSCSLESADSRQLQR
jgi:hypothetical protein